MIKPSVQDPLMSSLFPQFFLCRNILQSFSSQNTFRIPTPALLCISCSSQNQAISCLYPKTDALKTLLFQSPFSIPFFNPLLFSSLFFFFSFNPLFMPSHCSLFSAHCSLLTVLCSLFSAHCSLLTVLCSLFSAHCSLLTVLCSLSAAHCPLHAIS